MRCGRTIACVWTIVLAALVATEALSADRLARRPAPETRSERPRIVNGQFTSEYPSVGALLSPSDPDTAESWCSGTMIGCETFLTAAHCVCETFGEDCQPGEPDEPSPEDFAVFLQHAGFFSVTAISVHPSYDFPSADVAVLKLGAPMTGIRPSAINTVGTPPDGSMATIVGFGRSGGSSFDYGLKRVGKVQTEVTGCDADQVCWSFASPVGPPGEDSNTCNADSGGPLFWDGGSGALLAGITSGGLAADCTANDFSYDADVYTYRAYIQAEAGADLGAASCGPGPHVGDPDVTVTAFEGTLSSGNPSDVWSFAVDAGASSLRVALNAGEVGVADFDLYVKLGSPPTTDDYDCKADGPNQYGFCEIASPAAGTWHVLVNRFSGSAAYQITATALGGGGCHAGNEGAPCDDGDPCTSGDSCQTSVCTGSAVPDGTSCDDGRPCTQEDACQAGVCSGDESPRTDCAVSVVPGGSVLVLRDPSGENRDALSWSWKRGEATSKEDFGDPTAGSSYALCVFDETAGQAALVEELAVPGGPLWDESSSGWNYADRDAAAGGLRRIALRAGIVDGRSRIKLSARGAALSLPTLPLAQDGAVTVQLVGENACWGATYSTSITNRSDRFRAKSD